MASVTKCAAGSPLLKTEWLICIFGKTKPSGSSLSPKGQRVLESSRPEYHRRLDQILYFRQNRKTVKWPRKSRHKNGPSREKGWRGHPEEPGISRRPGADLEVL
jgi:hypothetical protein